MLRITGDLLDYLVLADSALLLRLADDQIRVITDDREAVTGKVLRQEMDALPAGTAEHRVAHREYLRAMRAYRNRDSGFWVADANSDAAAHALTGSVMLAELRDLAPLSDGAGRLADRFGLLTHRAIMDLLRDDCLANSSPRPGRPKRPTRTAPAGPAAKLPTTRQPSIALSHGPRSVPPSRLLAAFRADVSDLRLSAGHCS
jgi:hypothetical protein